MYRMKDDDNSDLPNASDAHSQYATIPSLSTHLETVMDETELAVQEQTCYSKMSPKNTWRRETAHYKKESALVSHSSTASLLLH